MQTKNSMSITSKIVLDQRRPKADNTCPVRLRVYKNTEYKELTLGINVKPENWDCVHQLVLPSDTSNDAYNAIISSKKTKLHKLILLAELNEPVEISLSDIIAQLSNDRLPSTKAKKESTSIIKYGQDIIKQLTSSGKVGNAFAYGCAVSKLKSFVNTDNFPFEELNYKKLIEFQDSMLADNIKVNSISVYMRTIRAIYNRAIKEGVVAETAYPFKAYRIKNEKTANRTLTINEMQRIVKLKLIPNTPIWHWRNYFLLSFCLIGINFADLLTLTGDNIVNDRIVFRRKKTGKIYTIKLHKRATDILSNYTDVNNAKKGELLLPVLKQTSDPVKLKKDIWQAIKTCNEYLVRIAKMKEVNIKKDTSTYYARYAWGNAARSLKYSKDIIGQAYGHSYGNATTSIYLLDYDNKIIDAANKKVIAAVFG